MGSLEGHVARRCGWAVVASTPNLVPFKAMFGGLGRPIQTVPRAERIAALRGLEVAAGPTEFVTYH
eukprot:1399536-Pyramimonas_sp.AAC.1